MICYIVQNFVHVHVYHVHVNGYGYKMFSDLHVFIQVHLADFTLCEV